jgi:drug/metabolite transporter (DMT)-like permease
VTEALAIGSLGAVSALGSAVTWTLISLIVRALSAYFTSVSINVIRSAAGGALAALMMLAWNGPGAFRSVTPEAFAYMAVSTVIAFGLGDSTFFESTKHLGLARAMTVSMIYPLIAAGLALLFLGERLTPPTLAGAIVTLGGLAIIVSERSQGPDAAGSRRRGIALALLAAVAWAAGALLMKRPLRVVDPVTAQALRLPLAALVLWCTPWARGTTRSLRAHARVAGLLIVMLSVLTAVSSVMFAAGLKYTSVGIATVLSSTAPLFALPIGFVAFREPITWRAATGASLGIAGIAILTL